MVYILEIYKKNLDFLEICKEIFELFVFCFKSRIESVIRNVSILNIRYSFYYLKII